MAVALSTDMRPPTPGSVRRTRSVGNTAASGAAGTAGTDPVADLLARVLTVPLQECYALLWRAGVVQIVE